MREYFKLSVQFENMSEYAYRTGFIYGFKTLIYRQQRDKTFFSLLLHLLKINFFYHLVICTAETSNMFAL